MSQDQILSVFQESLWLVMKLAGPMLIASIAIGLVISILQAATQIHEQTLTFVPKLIVISLILLIMAPWMISMVSDFAMRIFELISDIN